MMEIITQSRCSVPIANLQNYSAGLNKTVTLDAGASFDLDNYDSVTVIDGTLNGDGTFVDGNETMTIGPLTYPNQVRVGLKVNDETFSTGLMQYTQMCFFWK